MTTPSEGPGWQQGEWLRATDWLADLSQEQQQNLTQFVGMTPDQRQAAMNFINLDDRQQANLMRAANTDPLRDRMTNAVRGAVARVHVAYDNTQQRVSEAAVALQAQARQYRDTAVTGVTRAYEGTRDTVVQGARDARGAAVQAGRDVRTGAEELGQQVAGAYNRGVDRVNAAGRQITDTYTGARDGVVDAARRGQIRVDQAWERGANRLNETGQQIAQGAAATRDRVNDAGRVARDAVVGAGRDTVAAGRNAVGRAGRWVEGKFNNTMIKAESTLASFNAGRHNPDLQSSTFAAKDRAEMAQKFSAAMSAPTMEARNEILQGMAQQSQAQVEAHQSASAALSGVAPAGQAVAAAPAQPQTSGQGEQTNPNLTKGNENNNKGIGGR